MNIHETCDSVESMSIGPSGGDLYFVWPQRGYLIHAVVFICA